MDECPEDEVMSVAAVDNVRELVFAEETPSSELSPFTSNLRFLEAPVRRLRGLLRFVGESCSSPLASSGSREFLEGFLLCFLVGLDCLDTDLLPPPISSVGVRPPSSSESATF